VRHFRSWFELNAGSGDITIAEDESGKYVYQSNFFVNWDRKK
jgi:hypothetical protein